MKFPAKPLSLLLTLYLFAGPVLAETSSPAEREASERSFAVGEKLTYAIRWGILRAGTAVLEVNPVTELNGEEVYHFSLDIRTTPLVDKFYKVRDRIEGFARTDLQGSVLYRMKKEEGKNLRDVEVVYNAHEGWAQYTNFEKARDPVEIPPSTFDPLSVLFALREMSLKDAETIELPVSDGKKVNMGIARIRNERRITVPAGNYRTILVEPDMADVGGVFDKSGDSPMQVYFSNDKRQIPVRLASEVAVGTFTADLVSIEQMSAKELAHLKTD